MVAKQDFASGMYLLC